jgi:hypothetical protein
MPVTRPSLLAALVVLASPAFSPAAEQGPAPRAVYPRFAVEYLPKVGGQGVIGIRPAEVARYATKTEVAAASGLVFGTFAQLLGGRELDAAAWPTFADLEQCVCCLQIQVTAPPSKDERGTFMLGGKTPALLRTVRPFDWNLLIRKSFPNATAARHAGRAYLRMPTFFNFPLPFVGALGEPMSAFLPDDRTLVIGAEGDIRALLERLTAGKPAPEPPPGWGEVDRDLIAFALDNREVPLISGKFPDGYATGKELEALAGSVRTFAVGLSVDEDRTRVRLVATARNPRQARIAAAALTDFFRRAAELTADGEEPDALDLLGSALFKSAAIDHAGSRVTGFLSARGNLVKVLFTLLRGPA